MALRRSVRPVGKALGWRWTGEVGGGGCRGEVGEGGRCGGEVGGRKLSTLAEAGRVLSQGMLGEPVCRDLGEVGGLEKESVRGEVGVGGRWGSLSELDH